VHETYTIDPEALPAVRRRLIVGKVVKNILILVATYGAFALPDLLSNELGLLTARPPLVVPLRGPAPASQTGLELLLKGFNVLRSAAMSIFFWGPLYCPLSPFLGLLVVMFFLNDYRDVKRRMETLASIQVTIEGGTATRDVLGYDQMRVARDDVTHVQDFNDGFVVMTADPERWLGVPDLLSGYQEVREYLLAWGPLKPYTLRLMLQRRVIPQIPIFAGLVVFLLLIATYVPLLVGVSGLITVLLLGRGYWLSRKQEQTLVRRLWDLAPIAGVLAFTVYRLVRLTR